MKDSYREFLFHQGTNFEAYSYLGCNVEEIDGKKFFSFRTWAPNADLCELVFDAFGWDNPIPMKRITDKGVWETYLEYNDNYFGLKYKFKITNRGRSVYKGDPYALYSVGNDDGASIIYDRNKFIWSDAAWMERRKREVKTECSEFLSIPINVYEMHIGSFMKNEFGSNVTYRELAEFLPQYLKRMSFTHVEFMPLQEHPFEASWGYQVCGFFAVSSRYGTPDDFKSLINTLHKAGIGIILDFVVAHFPKDEWGLYEFDGSDLYEYQGADRRESKVWGTRFFDIGREEVQAFLISSAMYFLREMHIDGLRFDAVASMLYLDYDKDDGQWIPNQNGSNENLESIAFFKKMNSAIKKEFHDVLTIAEESGSYGKITTKSQNSLGFDLKWNMGFANDFYDYVKIDPCFRKYYHSALNFPITYSFSENYVLPISHDEVVHGKKSFADKMYGTIEEKLEEARASLLFFMTFPGKKLSFMGYEFAQIREWDHSSELEWFMLDFPKHYLFREYVKALNCFYLSRRELWEIDFSEEGFEWISCDENEKNSIIYKRLSKDDGYLIVALNFSGAEQDLFIPSFDEKILSVIFDTGNVDFCSKIIYDKGAGFNFRLPARSGVVLEGQTYLL